jgi:hypothetical protein
LQAAIATARPNSIGSQPNVKSWQLSWQLRYRSPGKDFCQTKAIARYAQAAGAGELTANCRPRCTWRFQFSSQLIEQSVFFIPIVTPRGNRSQEIAWLYAMENYRRFLDIATFATRSLTRLREFFEPLRSCVRAELHGLFVPLTGLCNIGNDADGAELLDD